MVDAFVAGAELPPASRRKASPGPRPHRPSSVRPEEVGELRLAWERALAAAPGRSRLFAARACRPVYERLRLADPEWLFSERRRYNPKPNNQRRVDWAGRDSEWEPRIRAAARALTERRPPVRLTRMSLVRAAGLPRGALLSLDRMPGCGAAVSLFAEDTDSFHVRLLRSAAAGAVGARANALRLATGLTGPLGPRARIELACLSDGFGSKE